MSEYGKENRPSRAILFIEATGTGFKITDEAKEFLLGLENKSLGIVSVVGKYRTGKSYFMNKILLNRTKNNGFSVGSTVNPCTKG